jgi:uncharacterized YigZ family protein
MNLPDKIKTIDEFKEIVTSISKSRFIARVYNVTYEDEAKDHLTKSKKQYYDASHHCYAFKLANGTVRYSDAGEPGGTAGVRILNAIEHFGLSNQLIIVSRIFGGTKLGAGPLGKAYYDSANKVLSSAKVIQKQLFQKAVITSGFEQENIIHKILANYRSFIVNSEYQDELILSCFLKANETEIIKEKLSEAGKGRIILTIHREFVYK